ncbi:hypothetical protein ABT369_07785 [Dactylosporangium sp. NPDC000244]|uniref:hypothetical protein n=1 Tax=Dactylosporangium sp. NPDC000244 TaxID=3154365 RepID=UPI0033343B03
MTERTAAGLFASFPMATSARRDGGELGMLRGVGLVGFTVFRDVRARLVAALAVRVRTLFAMARRRPAVVAAKRTFAAFAVISCAQRG